jgi:type IV secretory pathway TrbD component
VHAARAVVDGADGADHLRHHAAILQRHLRGTGGQFVGGLGIAGIAAHRLRQLLHRTHSAQQFRGLLLGAQRQVQVAAGDGVRCIADGGKADVGCADRAVHAVETGLQAAAVGFGLRALAGDTEREVGQ